MPDTHHAAWYVVHTKPRQEPRALENLQNQGYECFLPMMQVEKLRNRRLQVLSEPMFSRYLFICLDDTTQNWSPIRSTLGVSNLVCFGHQPAKVPLEFIQFLKETPAKAVARIFSPGDAIKIVDGPLSGLEGIYQAHDSQARAFVLVDMLGKPQRLQILVEGLRAA
jgi:transcriptional antiterminator RfaH